MIGKWIETQEEYQLVIAKEDKTTIGDLFTQNKVEKVVEYVTKWNIMLGGKVLEKHEYNVILEFIKNNYAQYKVKELELIMNFSVSNNSTQSLGYFQKLTCSSISVSFNHYKEYKAEMLSKINLKKSRYEQSNIPSVMPTDEERLQIHKENMIQQFKRLDAKQPILDFGDILFNWLVKRKEIKKETFDSFGEKAILEWERFKKTQARSEYNIKQLKDIEFMTNKRKNFIIEYCKQQSIRNYLASINNRQTYLDSLKINDL